MDPLNRADELFLVLKKRVSELLEKIPGASVEAIVAGAIESTLFRSEEFVFRTLLFENALRSRDALDRSKKEHDMATNALEQSRARTSAWRTYKRHERLSLQAFDEFMKLSEERAVLYERDARAALEPRPD